MSSSNLAVAISPLLRQAGKAKDLESSGTDQQEPLQRERLLGAGEEKRRNKKMPLER